MADTYKNAKLIDVPASLTDVYTCPGSTVAVVKAIHVANKDAADQEFSVGWTDASDSNLLTYLAADFVCPLKAANQVIDGALILNAGDKIRAIATNASVLDITVSLVERPQ